jgi:two-component system phosphate regulon sensor histidine kinase PhoR
MTIFRKSLLTLGLAALLFFIVLGAAVLVFMNELYYETNAAGLRDTAKTLLAVYLETGTGADYFADPGGPPEIFPLAGASYRLTLINRSGGVLWDSHVQGELVNHLDREEVRTALDGEEGSARRNSLSTGMKQIYCALPVYGEDGKPAGVFRLSRTVPGFWRRIAPAAGPFLLLACAVFAVAFAAVFVFSRSLSSSLAALVSIVKEAAAGPWYSETPFSGRRSSVSGSSVEEFFTLEKALRGMAGELNLRIEKARAEGGRLAAILNGMSEAVFAMDGGLVLHLVNPRARKLFGLAGDPRGLSLLEAVRSTELEKAAKTAFVESRVLELELTLRTAGGERRFQVFAAPFSAEAENTESGVVMVLEDITRLVRLEQIRRDFIANVSHELRTPIQLIKGFSETLLDFPDEAGEKRRCMEIISKNAVTMENLVNDLLSLSSIENENDPALEEQEIAPLAAEALSLVEIQTKKKNIEIIANCSADLKVKVCGRHIVQALVNLLDNAIKYSNENSRVWLGVFSANGKTVLEVRDEGIGIPFEHQQRIFERFYRVNRGQATGTGLGLSIVRHIALLHKGTAEVESRFGEGSVFRIYLPASGRNNTGSV